jgi:hypothetical protein
MNNLNIHTYPHLFIEKINVGSPLSYFLYIFYFILFFHLGRLFFKSFTIFSFYFFHSKIDISYTNQNIILTLILYQTMLYNLCVVYSMLWSVLLCCILNFHLIKKISLNSQCRKNRRIEIKIFTIHQWDNRDNLEN